MKLKTLVGGLLVASVMVLGSIAMAGTASGDFGSGPGATGPGATEQGKWQNFGGYNGSWTVATGNGAEYSAYNFVYNPNSYQWEKLTNGTESGTDGFIVTADIEMWLNMHYNQNRLDFQIGQDLGANPAPFADMTGNVTSNNGQFLFLTCPNQQSQNSLDYLVMTNDIFGNPTKGLANEANIPVYWFLSDTAGFRAPEYSTAGNNGQTVGYTWLLDGGAAGSHDFTIRAVLHPLQYQADGHYELDPQLVASPVL